MSVELEDWESPANRDEDDDPEDEESEWGPIGSARKGNGEDMAR
jgi:hypothetical protein